MSDPPPETLPELSVGMAASLYAAFTAVAVGWAALTDPGLELLTALPVARVVPWWAAGAGWGLALVLGSVVSERLVPSVVRMAHELAGMLGPSGWGRAAVLALLSGVAEEALFRGPMQYAFGFAVTTVLFALAHGGLSARYLPWSTFALIAGGGFGILAGAYESIAPAILAHVLVNLINIRRITRLYGHQPGPDA